MRRTGVRERQLVSVNGGLLVQDLDTETCTVTAEMAVTKRRPEAALLADMDFAWRIVKHVKSNAIVVVKDGCTAGIGAGQMNRVGSAEIALREAREKGVDRRARARVGRFPALRRYGDAGGRLWCVGHRAARRQHS